MIETQHTEKLHEWASPISSAWLFRCPACKENHTFTVNKDGSGWGFNGNIESPTFTPSLLYPDKAIRCHLFLTDGKIQYCGDCGHDFRGQTVDMEKIEPWDF